MIVCSLPRCGATSFCLDLQDQTGLKFVGELNPMYLYDNRKAEAHETKYQLTFTPEQFADIVNNNDDCILLVNKAPHLSLAKCSYVILRRNMLDAFMSFANFLLKMYPDIDTKILINEVQFSIYDYYGLKAYIDRYPKDVIWYEDYFGIEGTKTELLDQHKHGRLIKKAIRDAYDVCG